MLRPCTNAHAHVGRLDHSHVVGAVTDGEGHRALDTVAHEADDLRLLRRGAAAAHDAGAVLREAEEGRLAAHELPRATGAHHVLQALAIDDQRVLGSLARPQLRLRLHRRHHQRVAHLLGGRVGLLGYDVHLAAVVHQLAGEGNVDGGLLLLVFDGGAAEHLQLELQLVAQPVDLVGEVVALLLELRDVREGLAVGRGPCEVGLGLEHLLRHHEAAQALVAVVLHGLLGRLHRRLLPRLEQLHHDSVRTLAQQADRTGGRVAHDHRHASPLRCELEHVEHLVHDVRLGVVIVQLHLLLVAIEEVEAEVGRGRDEGGLVGRRGREATVVAHGLCDHSVAQREVEEEVAALALLLLAALAVERSVQLGPVKVDDLVRTRIIFGGWRQRQAQPLEACDAHLRGALAVTRAGDAALAELHDVLRQRASLVGEDVRDDARLVDQSHGAHGQAGVGLLVVDVQRLLGEPGVQRLDARHAEGEHDRDEAVEQREVLEEDDDRVHSVARQVPRALDARRVAVGDDDVTHRAHEAEGGQE
eukprot:scaffold11175_cov63-Phaeocystis_antarctica.AAC.2